MDAPHGSQCPEDGNSTDCLLRALLKLQAAESSEYNWDPITFAFTTVISAVALMFAITAVFQAVLASGKGRRRCSEKVIGQWSKECKTGIRTWDWSEMNFHPTAVTPVLRAHYNSVLRGFVPRYQSSLPLPLSRQEAPRSEDVSWKSSAASWLIFFENLGLDKYSAEGWGDNKRSVAANYLPDDLVAAPAYAQVGAVVVAAVMAGARKLDVDEQQYPNLFGPDFQVDFRQHPGLGVVGAYSQYGGFRDQTALSRFDLVAKQDQFATSVVKYGPGFVDARSGRRIRPHQLLGVWYHYNRQLLLRRETSSFNCFILEMNAVSEEHLPLLVGLLAETPKYVPMVFPTATMTTACHHYLKAFALNSWYFAHAPFDRSWDPMQYVIQWFEQFHVPNWEGFSWCDRSEMPKAFRETSDESSEEGIPEYLSKLVEPSDLQLPTASPCRTDPLAHTTEKSPRGYHVILNMCLTLVQEPEKLETWFFERSPELQDMFRELILKQLQEVDEWLRNKDPDPGIDLDSSVVRRSCAVMLFNTTVFLLHTEEILRAQDSEKANSRLIPQSSRQSAGITTAYNIHADVLQVCEHLIDTRNTRITDEISPQHSRIDDIRDELIDIVHFEQGPRETLLWDRLSVLVHHREKHASKWPSESYQGVKKEIRDFEDMVVYRCLLMGLLFLTATDTSMMLPLMKSGVWDKVVPMI